MCPVSVPLYQRILVVILVAVLCLHFVVGTFVSADVPYVDLIPWEEYSNDLDGAIEYIGDNLGRIAHNTGALGYNVIAQPIFDGINNVEDYFGVDFFPDGSGLTSEYYNPFADWYLGHGNADGGGYRDGSPTLDTNGSYSWGDPKSPNAVYLDDGNGGFFTIIDNSHVELPYTEVIDYSVYYHGNCISSVSRSYDCAIHYKPSGISPVKPTVLYGIYTIPDSSNACFWTVWKNGYQRWAQSDEAVINNIQKDTSYMPQTLERTYSWVDGQWVEGQYKNVAHNVSRYYFTVKSYDKPNITNNTTTVYSYDPTTNNFTNNYYYGADDNGQPCLYDTNNNIVNFNNDGTINSNNGTTLYLIPDFSKLSDIDLNYFNNAVKNYYNQVYINLIRQKNPDNNLNGIYALLSQCLGQLGNISQNEYLQSSYLNSINQNIISLFDKLGNSPENGDLMLLLLELKQGILGNNPDNDNIIDLLKKIEENTKSEEYSFIDIFKHLFAKFHFVSYFKQLENFLTILFGSSFNSGSNYEAAFDISNFLSFSDNDNTVTLSMSTADAPEIYGEDLAEADIDVNSSLYLQQCALAYSDIDDPSSISNVISYPFTFMGVEYDLFSGISSDVIEIVDTLKGFMSLLMYISWIFWILKSAPNLFASVGSVDSRQPDVVVYKSDGG